VVDVGCGEVCDDGNVSGGDGCSADCLSDESCGNGIVDTAVGEVCDDGNNSDGDGCSADCSRDETLCGNSSVDPGEACDDGNLNSHDGCSSGCTTETLRWTDISPAVNPGARYGHVTAYAPTRDRVVLYGGRTSAQVYYQDTWEFDGTQWLNTTPATTPPGRQFAAMAYDSLREQMVMFGGRDAVGNLSGTWAYDGSQWTQLPTVGEPSARRYVSMAYDSLRDRMVMFGGYDTATLAETWEFDGNQWIETTPAISPPMRYAYALSYDSARGVVIMFGGGYYWNGSYYRRGDTWEYNGTQWVETTPAVSPAGRSACHSAYDTARNLTVMLGGSDGAGGLYAGTWEYDGSTTASWVDVSPTFGPAARVHPRLVYDTRRRRVLFYGGNDGVAAFDDTWIFNISSDWPDEICTSGADVDLDGLTDCADPDCDGQLCNGGTCAAGVCQ
jgi:cysteine-rich repeat protein